MPRGARQLLWVCGSMLALTASAAARTVNVRIYNDDFSAAPKGQAVLDPILDLGDTVRWNWEAGGHSTRSAAGQAESWNSGVNGFGSTFDHAFSKVGVFWYFCLPHGFDRGDGTAGGMAGTITVTYPGDANADFAVDLTDFGILKGGFGSGTTRARGDFTHDGTIDLSDFGVLKDNFGRSMAAPEPSSAALALLATAGAYGLSAARRRAARSA